MICLCGGQEEVSSLRLPASFCFREIVQSLHFPEGSPSVLRPDYFDLSTHQYWIYANYIDHEVPNRPTWITQQAGANANPSNTILISPISPTMTFRKYQILIPSSLLSAANLLGIQTLCAKKTNVAAGEAITGIYGTSVNWQQWQNLYGVPATLPF